MAQLPHTELAIVPGGSPLQLPAGSPSSPGGTTPTSTRPRSTTLQVTQTPERTGSRHRSRGTSTEYAGLVRQDGRHTDGVSKRRRAASIGAHDVADSMPGYSSRTITGIADLKREDREFRKRRRNRGMTTSRVDSDLIVVMPFPADMVSAAVAGSSASGSRRGAKSRASTIDGGSLNGDRDGATDSEIAAGANSLNVSPRDEEGVDSTESPRLGFARQASGGKLMASVLRRSRTGTDFGLHMRSSSSSNHLAIHASPGVSSADGKFQGSIVSSVEAERASWLASARVSLARAREHATALRSGKSTIAEI